MAKHLMIGAGEIGASFYNLLRDFAEVEIRDKESDIIGQFDYLHIAFPFTDKDSFIKQVKEYEAIYQPQTIIVHSTVAPGTIRALGEKAVHAPVRGRHPNLEGGIKTFRLYVGGNDSKRVNEVANILKQFAADVYPLDPAKHSPETTELLKILDTTYLGWNVIYEREVHRLCQQYNVDFETVYTDANKSYNSGYSTLGNPEFARPVFKHFPGKMGGHCVIPNCHLLPESFVTKLILEKDQEFDQNNS
jgi:UDP-N-acetyl-D-mannosaminuronate dehydrogenase